VSLAGFANSRIGARLGIALGRVLPRDAAYSLAKAVARRVAASGSPITDAIRANQAVVRGIDSRDPALQPIVEQVLRTAAVGYVDLFRAMARGQAGLLESMELHPKVWAWLQEHLAVGRGLLAVSAHLSCFDMILLSLPAFGYPFQALAFSDPRGSYLVQNAMRIAHGVDLTPISPQSLRSALRRLKDGGIALTGIDRPDPDGEILQFFGQPARMPVGHARLAIMSGSQVMVGVCEERGVAHYGVAPVERLDAKSYTKRGEGPRKLAQDILLSLEPVIRARPEQWLMFFPVWPQFLPGANA
jgi:KDO2-lipid IV(A) lauroyltransferase